MANNWAAKSFDVFVFGIEACFISHIPKLTNIGKGFNDLGDEIECREALNNGTYIIVDIKTSYMTNKYEKRLYASFSLY